MSGSLVVCVGLCVVDLILTVENLPRAGGKFFADGSVESAGGPAATASAAIARLGGDVRFVGRLGDDARGDRALSLLAAAGVETIAERLPGVSSPVSAVLVTPDGERTIVNHTDRRLFETRPPSAALTGARAVLADVRWPAGAVAAMQWAAETGVPGVLDLDRVPPGDIDRIRPAVEAASHVVASASGMEPFAANVEALAETAGGWVAVTAGGEGVKLPGGRLPAPAIRAVETLGAGDVFHGAFALALAEGRDESQAIRFASAAAAAKCRRTGGWSALGDRDEVERLMEETWT